MHIRNIKNSQVLHNLQTYTCLTIRYHSTHPPRLRGRNRVPPRSPSAPRTPSYSPQALPGPGRALGLPSPPPFGPSPGESSSSGPSTCHDQKSFKWVSQAATLRTIALSRRLLLVAHLAVSREGVAVVLKALLRRQVTDRAGGHCPTFPASHQPIFPRAHPQGMRTEGAARRSEPRHAPTPTDAAATPNPKKSKNFL